MVDWFSILIGIGIGLVPSFSYLILRGTLFEYQEWRKRKQETNEWFNEVERKANGIERAWYYSGVRLEDQDRERAVEEMDELMEDLKTYRRHQNATDEMVVKMSDIIHRWDACRHLILSSHGKLYFERRGVDFSEAAEGLNKQLDQDRQGYVRKFPSIVAAKVRDGIERYRRWKYSKYSLPISYNIHRELSAHLPDDQIGEIAEGDAFFRVNRGYGTEAVYYDQDEDKYNPLRIDSDQNGEFVIIDKLEGLTTPESQLLPQLQEEEIVDTIPYEDIVPDGQSFDEFEKSDSN